MVDNKKNMDELEETIEYTPEELNEIDRILNLLPATPIKIAKSTIIPAASEAIEPSKEAVTEPEDELIAEPDSMDFSFPEFPEDEEKHYEPPESQPEDDFTATKDTEEPVPDQAMFDRSPFDEEILEETPFEEDALEDTPSDDTALEEVPIVEETTEVTESVEEIEDITGMIQEIEDTVESEIIQDQEEVVPDELAIQDEDAYYRYLWSRT